MGHVAGWVGGACWIAYGIGVMLQPFGIDVVYRDSLGYSEVVDRGAFLAHNAPGAVALVLTSALLLHMIRVDHAGGSGMVRAARAAGFIALGLGFISVAAVAIFVDPVFTAARIFGTFALGVGTALAAVVAWRRAAPPMPLITVVATAAIGIFLLPLWPVVYALRWLPPAGGAIIIAMFGFGWAAIGYLMRSGSPALIVTE